MAKVKDVNAAILRRRKKGRYSDAQQLLYRVATTLYCNCKYLEAMSRFCFVNLLGLWLEERTLQSLKFFKVNPLS